MSDSISTTINIPSKYINAVRGLLKANEVKYMPFTKVSNGYKITIIGDHPVISFLQLRYN